MNQEEADAIAQLLALREKWAEVSTIKEKWEANKVYCVAPKDVRVPLHLLVVAALDAPTPELAKRYVQKIAEIVEWVWPTNTRQRFDVYQLGDVMVEIPTKKGS